MRKALLLATALVGIGGLFAAAKAGQHTSPERDDAQITGRTESLGKSAKDISVPPDRGIHEARERSREERRVVKEEEDEDRD